MKGSSLGMTSALARGILVTLGLASQVPAYAGSSISDMKSQYGAQLQVLGQVQQIDSTKGTIVVAGQHVSISRQTAFLVGNVEAANPVDELLSIKPGDVLAVFGSLDSPRYINRPFDRFLRVGIHSDLRKGQGLCDRQDGRGSED